MVISIDSSSSEAPYEQIRRQIAVQAADGTLAPGHKLPTVRQLATDLGLAANTAARAYRELEADGVIETHGRKGTLIASAKMTDDQAQHAAETYTRIARRQGLSRDEAIRLVEKHWTT
ncbi:GntR family transcriptional regulator [soil metagenome]